MGLRASKTTEHHHCNKTIDLTTEKQTIEGKQIPLELNNQEKESTEEEQYGNKQDNNIIYNYHIPNNNQINESGDYLSDIDIKEELMQYKESLITNIKNDINKYKIEIDTYKSNSFSLTNNTLTLIENDMIIDKGLFNSEQSETNKENAKIININQLRDYNQNQFEISNTTDNSENIDYVIKELCKEKELKSSHISKLIYSKINESQTRNKESTMIIFDWDDTLLCTTFLTPNGDFDSDKTYNIHDEEKIAKLEMTVLSLLTQSIENGDTYIITNSIPGWVQYSAHRFYPSVVTLLETITIIYAREDYEKIYPNDSCIWKIKAFLEMYQKIDVKKKINIICIGDSFIEIEAAKALKTNFNQANIKSIKFRAASKIDELNKQLSLLLNNFSNILAINKSIIMTVIKKQKTRIEKQDF